MEDRKKILIVEDSADARDLLALCLTRIGYDVSVAVDGIDALEQVIAVHPDLIVMDISMSRMDGLEATKLLKSNPLTREIPVIIATAHAEEHVKRRAAEVGALDLLTKPLDFLALGERLGKYLTHQETTGCQTHPEDSRPGFILKAT